MTRLASLLVAVATLAAAGGCTKKSEPPPPFKGPLTIATIMAAKEIVQPFDPWDDAFALLQSRLGPPTHVKESASGPMYQWAADAGETCAYVEVGKEDGKKYQKEGMMVGAVMNPMTVDKKGPVGNRADCLAILGKDGPPEDPNAAPPPADGVATPELVIENAVKGRSKWTGKKLKVTSTLEGIGGIALTLGKAGLSCVLADNAPAGLELGKELTVEGTVKMETWVSGGGEVSMKPALSPCAIVK